MGLLIKVKGPIFIIKHKERLFPYFYLYDIIEHRMKTSVALWTPNTLKAREFYSEESVETFFYERLSNRPCEIILVK